MGLRTGLLREIITIQKLTNIKDSFGATSDNWIDKFNARAQVTTNSGDRLNQNNEIRHSYNVTFTIRFYHDVQDTDRIIYNDTKYRIISINKELNKQAINIIAETINN